MTWTHYILRGLLIIVTVLLLFYLNRKANDNIELIEKHKFETLDNIKDDSLNTKYRFDLLDNEATKFSGQIFEDTYHIKKAINYLIGVIGLLIAVELGFIFSERKKTNK